MKLHERHFANTRNNMSAVLSDKYPCPVHLIADGDRPEKTDLFLALLEPAYTDGDMVVFEDGQNVTIGALRTKNQEYIRFYKKHKKIS